MNQRTILRSAWVALLFGASLLVGSVLGQEPGQKMLTQAEVDKWIPIANPGLAVCPDTRKLGNEKVCWDAVAKVVVRKRRNRVVRVLHYLVKPVADPDTLIAMAPFFVGLGLDAVSTSDVLRRCRGCVEKNIFLPKRPSNRDLWLYAVVYSYGQAHATYAFKNMGRAIAEEERENERLGQPHSKAQRFFFGEVLWRLYPAAVGGLHASAARKNYKIISCPSGFYKPAGLPGCLAE